MERNARSTRVNASTAEVNVSSAEVIAGNTEVNAFASKVNRVASGRDFVNAAVGVSAKPQNTGRRLCGRRLLR